MNHDPSFKFSEIKTKVELLDTNILNNAGDLNIFIADRFSEEGFAVAYLDYRVLIGTYNSTLNFFQNETIDPKYIQRLRVFNKKSEFFMWRIKPGSFKGRIRRDEQEDSESVKAVDALQVLWGTKKEHKDNGWSLIYEDRGTAMIVPFESDKITINDKEKRVKLLTRNYIQHNSLGQAGYIDSRFMDIVPPHK